MNTINNSRSKETESNLKKTILTLMSEGKNVNEITVKEICEKCGINRSTFYAHYSIPEDILKEIEEETLKDTQKYISSMTGNEQESTALLLSYMEKHQMIFRILLNTRDNTFSERLISQSFPIFHQIELAPVPKHQFQYIKDYAIHGAKAVILSWLSNDKRETADQIADLIIILCKKVIDIAFTRKKKPDTAISGHSVKL